jgi:nitroimidazol reductase NimA-like FMN-containing flavoprotein (pyridoxamine 5'-phosphate oxidase superfamily)
MLGQLDDKQIERVLQIERMGRIGCLLNDRVYVVPITYAYDDGSIYGHSAEGLKVDAMRAHPEVCFEVDQVDNLAHWRSVIAWGTYEELHGDDAQRALQLLVERLAPRRVSESALLPLHKATPPTATEVSRSAVAFRIRLTEKTGRFERTSG